MVSDNSQNGGAGPRSHELAGALDAGEVTANFLPKVDLRNGRVIGVEALARWNHPRHGILPAARFLDLVKDAGQRRRLTEAVVEHSTRAAGDWWQSGLRLELSLNLFPASLAEGDRDLGALLSDSLAAARLPAEALGVEVTEDALSRDPEEAGRSLERLGALGIMASIDDFGMGHFSLRQLMSLPVRELKIDRSLIAGLQEDENRAIVRATIHLAHQLGLQVVAEGVESDAAWRRLRSMGCELAQGFLIAEPLTAREVPAWLAAWGHRARELTATKRGNAAKRKTGLRPRVAATGRR